MNYLNENIDSLNKKLASGDLSADKLAKDTVANIKDTDKKLNAWITVLDDAKPADNLDYSKSKLAGIPIAIKDNIITGLRQLLLVTFCTTTCQCMMQQLFLSLKKLVQPL